MNKIKIFLADDHAIVREGIRLILSSEENYEIIGESSDGKETIEMVESLTPDILILDISMPTMSGIEVSRHVRKYVPETKIIILSRHDNEAYISQLLEYGIQGYILKDDAGDDLIKGIDEVMNDNVYLSPKITTAVVSDYLSIKRSDKVEDDSEEQMPSFDNLTAREREVLKLIAEGNDNNSVSTILHISPKTVKTHRANIMSKLDIHKVNDLVAYAIKNGYIEI
jgi:DNA-binding NarL/FixJ family response regulator